MNDYKMQWNPAVVGLQWEYNFTMASDAMAYDYTKRQVKQISGASSFKSLLLWRMSNQTLIGHFKLDEPSVVEIPL